MATDVPAHPGAALTCLRGTAALLATTLSLIVAHPNSLQAQMVDESGHCTADGIVFRGQPTERVIVGEDSVWVEHLDQSEVQEYEALIGCVAGELRYLSRESRPTAFFAGGCFVQFDPGASGQIHALLDASSVCADEFAGRAFDYSEIIRTGIYQIIYRGRITEFRHPRPLRR